MAGRGHSHPKGLLAEVLRRARARPGVLAVAALLLIGAGFAGGWMSSARLGAPKVDYTSAPIHPLRPRPAPPAPAALQAELDQLAEAYGEPVGIAVTDVAQGWTAAVQGDQDFPQQSVSKLWVAMTVLDAVDHRRLALDQWVVMRPEDRSVFYQPVAQHITGPEGFAIQLSDLLRRAISESDNAANDKLMAEVGGAGPVTDAIAAKGLTGLAVGAYERDLQSKIAGLEWRPEYGIGWNFKGARAELPNEVRDASLAAYLADPLDGAQPAAITKALAALKRGELLSGASTDFLLGLMGEARTGPMRLKGGLPEGWSIAHKTGTGPDWRGRSVGINDVGLLTAPDGRSYAVAVMMRETRHPVTARLAFMQSITRAVARQWDASPADARLAEAR